MYSIVDFFEAIFYFIRHIPDALFFTFAYACGVRPYKVIATNKKHPAFGPEYFCSTLLPPTIKADSWEGRDWALSHFSEFDALMFKFYLFKELQPISFFKYLWDDVLMPFEF
jgi:hypothetical protein